MRRITSVALAVLLSFIALLALPAARSLDASCVQPAQHGKWKNVDPNTRNIPRIEVTFVCQDQIINGEPYPPGPAWKVHVWGRCHPTNCDWGEVGAELLSSGHVYARYNQGYAKRSVYAKMSTIHPGQMWVYVWTNFTDPSRPDYAISAYFVRE